MGDQGKALNAQVAKHGQAAKSADGKAVSHTQAEKSARGGSKGKGKGYV